MKMYARKLVVILTILGFLLVLSGCGKKCVTKCGESADTKCAAQMCDRCCGYYKGLNGCFVNH